MTKERKITPMESIKRILSLVMISLLVMIAGCGSQGTKTTIAGTGGNADSSSESSDIPDISGKYNAVITVKGLGEIKLELDADTAPITVANFIKLANEGFYDGLTFHRIIEGFMIQGGDPEGTGYGGSDETIKGEFSSNGVENSIKHERGVISMARSGDPNSASSQFFIMHKTSTHLDGDYAAFGHVTEGMDIVDYLAENTPVADGNGTVLADDQPVIESIKILD